MPEYTVRTLTLTITLTGFDCGISDEELETNLKRFLNESDDGRYDFDREMLDVAIGELTKRSIREVCFNKATKQVPNDCNSRNALAAEMSKDACLSPLDTIGVKITPTT